MRRIIIAQLIGITLWASAHEEYVPCAKTYIDPSVIFLHQKKIKVLEGEEAFQTSAIYSDENGLFYKDYLEKYDDEISSSDLALSDQQIDPFESVSLPEETPLYTDKLITQTNPQLLSSSPPQEEQPLHKNPKPVWPYSNKRR